MGLSWRIKKKTYIITVHDIVINITELFVRTVHMQFTLDAKTTKFSADYIKTYWFFVFDSYKKNTDFKIKFVSLCIVIKTTMIKRIYFTISSGSGQQELNEPDVI